MSEAWKHDDLAEDLRKYLEGNKADRMIWCDMQLGPAGSPRPDVYALPKTYSRFLPFAYEVKISRSDFFADVNVGKWQKYLAYASAVIFAVPDGLVKVTELPDGAGLICRKNEVWRVAKAPKVNALGNLPRDAWMKLLMDGRHRLETRRNFSEYYLREQAFKAALGEEIAKLASKRDGVKYALEREVEEHEKRLASIRARHDDERKRAAEHEQYASRLFEQLCDTLGIERRSPQRKVTQEFERRVRALDADVRIRDLVQVIDAAQHSLSQAKLRVTASPRDEAA